MSIQTLSTLLAAFLTFVIAWGVILRDRRPKHYLAFAILCLNLCFWYLATFFAVSMESSFARFIALVLGIAVPTSAERFFRLFLSDEKGQFQPMSRLVIFATAFAYLLLFAGVFYYQFLGSFWFRLPLFAFIFGSLSYSIYLIYDRRRTLAQSSSPSARAEATRLGFLFYGGVAAVALAATDFLPALGLPFPAIGNVLTVIYLYFVSQTLFHSRVLEIKELLAKIVTLSALVLLLSIIYGLLLAWVGPKQSGVFFFNTLVASFVILVIFEPMRTLIEEHANRLLFAEKHEFRRRLMQLNQSLANIIEVRPTITAILESLESSGRITHASIYLSDPSAQEYHLAGHVGPAPLNILDGKIRRLFLERLTQSILLTQSGIAQDTKDRSQEELSVEQQNLISTMEDLRADICIALAAEGQLLGFLNLRDERLKDAYSSDEIEQLKQLAAHASITLRNSKIYEQMKERERLAALGQMAAGLAHEIRNPLGAIKGAAQLLKDSTQKNQSDEDQEFLDIIVEEVDRLGHVVAQFLGYARPDRGEREMLLINDLVHKTLQLLRSEHSDDVLTINSKLSADLPKIRADPEQLRQVFLNLAINGIQAMDGKGTLEINTQKRSIYRGGKSAHFVEISFIDQGEGIEENALSNIFIPFFTTKEGGTGLGLPICQRIIENHGGLIEVRSQKGKGAVFSVLLPIEADDITGNFSIA